MKKQLLAALLAVSLALSLLPTHALAAGSGGHTEPSAAARTARSETDITPQSVYQTMIAYQSKDGYTEGTSWTDENHKYSWNGGPINGTNILATGCVAFAFELSDAAFGNLPARTAPFSFENVKVGDILRMNTDTHTVIVLEVSEAGVIVAEGNVSGKVHWGRAISKDVLLRDVSMYITRYPEGYIPPDDPTANETVASGTLTGGLAWNLTKAGTLTISGNGAMPADFTGPSDQPWYAHNSQIRKIVIENGVTSIGFCAFYGCGALSVEIPESVTSIGGNAFRESSLLYVSIPSNVKTIGDDAFRQCLNLASVTVSEGVETIGERAFQGCIKLLSVDLPASMKKMGSGMFYNCTKLWRVACARGNSNTVEIGDNLFSQCWALIYVTLPEKIDRIGEGMFQNCGGIAGLEIPQGATSIGGSAFASSGVSVLIIPASVTSIGIAAFSSCPLAEIYYTGTEAQWNSVQKIGDTLSVVSRVKMHYEYTPDHTEHTWGNGTITKPATCTTDGEQTYTCTVCGETKVETISATGHKYGEFTTTKEPTEEEDGEKTATCSVCGAKMTETIPAIKHNHNNFVVTKNPTCTEPGEKTATCSICGESWTEIVPATGHSFRISSSSSPTCTASGYTTYTCTACGQTKTETDSALGHNYRYSSRTDPTCTEAGSTTYTCTRCGRTRTEVIPATGHSYKAETTEPTCTEDGGTTYTCSKCGTIKKDVSPALGHNYSKTAEKAPTCTEPGITTYKCGRCDASYDVPDKPAAGHDFQEQADGSYRCKNGCGTTIPSVLHPVYVEILRDNMTALSDNVEPTKEAIEKYLGGRVERALHRDTAADETADYDFNILNGQFIDEGKKYQFQIGIYRSHPSARAADSAEYVLITRPLVLFLESDVPDQPVVISYTVRFDADGGSGTMEDWVVRNDQQPYKLPDCGFTAPEGMEFKAWLVDGVEREAGAEYIITPDSSFVENYTVMIKAVWVKLHTITFDANGGTGEMAPVTRLRDGEQYCLPECGFTAPEGMEFKAWEVSGIEREVNAEYIIKPEHDPEIIVKAVWVSQAPPSTIYAVTFDANGGSEDLAVVSTDIDGKLVSLPVPTREGYTFNGWFTAAEGGEAVTTDTVFEADTTIYAQWTENDTPPAPAAYTVTFDPNGGSVEPASATANENGKLDSLPVPTREGYTFNGWFTAAEGGEAVTADTVFEADTTIYAQWKEHKAPEPSDIQINGISASHAGENMFLITLPAGSAWPVQSDISIPAEAEGLQTEDGGKTWTFSVSNKDGVKVTYTILVEIKSGPVNREETYYISIAKADGGEVLANTRYAEEGERVTLSVHPAAGYELDSLTVSDIRGRAVTLRSLSGSRYSFTMPNSRVTAEASFVRQEEETPAAVPGTEHTAQQPDGEAFTSLGTPGISGIVLNPAPMPFTDVQTSDWFYNSVDYVWKHYLMSGVSDMQFAPNASTSRAMIWTILARMNNVRTDVNPGSTWFERGMLWAMEHGVTDGSNAMSDITREQLAVMLWRTAGSPGSGADLSQFSDASSVSGYAQTAVRWAVANGILNGSDGMLNPKGTAARAQVAAMIARYGDKIA